MRPIYLPNDQAAAVAAFHRRELARWRRTRARLFCALWGLAGLIVVGCFWRALR
jgi:hypothetical protein